jgi:hypothetical protein
VQAVHAKIAPINREELPDTFPFSDPEQASVGEVHRAVGVLAHQLANAGNIGQTYWQQLQRASLDHLPKHFLAAAQIAEKMHSLGHRRPHRSKRLTQVAQGRGATPVMLVVGVDEGDHRTCVDENHFFFRERRLFKSRPN